MARIPEGADLIDNPVSKAPGFRIGNVIVMAGVPSVMQAMLDHAIQGVKGGAVMLSANVEAENLPEGRYGDALGEIAKARPEVSIGSYPSFQDGKFRNQIVVRARDAAALEEARAAVAAMVTRLRGDDLPYRRVAARCASPVPSRRSRSPGSRAPGRSTPANSGSPRPSMMGDTARCISSIAPAQQILAHRRGAAADLDVEVARGGLGLSERRLDPLGDEMEGRAALHLDRRAGVVGQDEGRRVIGGIVAPPALPRLVGPIRRAPGRTCCGPG